MYWDKAKQLHTIQGYSVYLKLYPRGQYSNTAKEFIEKIPYDIAIAENSVASYKEYIKKYPNGKYIQEVKNKLEAIDPVQIAKREKAIEDKYAEDFDSLMNGYYSGRIKITFTTTGKKAYKVIEDVSKAAHVLDPMGFFNPYWVTYRNVAAKGNKGVIIGSWYTDNFQGYDDWYPRFSSQMNQISGISTYNVDPVGMVYSNRNSHSENERNACIAEIKRDEGWCYLIRNDDDLKNSCLAQIKHDQGWCYLIHNENEKKCLCS